MENLSEFKFVRKFYKNGMSDKKNDRNAERLFAISKKCQFLFKIFLKRFLQFS
jgi:hypothetical protein